MKFDIHSKNLKVVEKKKLWFSIPAIVLAIAIIFGVIYGIAFKGDVLNLGMDFTGGYTLTVKLGAGLDDATFREEKEKRVTDIIENPDPTKYDTSSVGTIEGLVVKNITMQGEGAEKALYVKFTADQYNYQVMMGDDDNEGIIEILSDLIREDLFVDDPYSGNVQSGSSVSATVSSELIITCICGVIMALALMLIYIAIRFEMLSGVVALICLVHDIGMMFLFMLIGHIEITSTFVAALITILGYSINNTIIIFDKVRDNVRTYPANSTPTKIANNAVRDTIVRSINTTGTTFVTVLMVAIVSAIVGVGDLITFCLPLIAGLIAGTFSSLFLAPTIWAIWKTKLMKKAPAVETIAPAVEAKKDDFFDGMDGDTTAKAEIESNEVKEEQSEIVEETAETEIVPADEQTAEEAETNEPITEQISTEGEDTSSETENGN